MTVQAEKKTVAVIPARYASTRFPGKPLADIGGKPMVVRVYERAIRAATLTRVVVATDDERIKSACEAHAVPVVMTRPDHASGTDRIQEAVASLEADIIVNVQGDEPLLQASMIDVLTRPLLAEDCPKLAAATLALPFPEGEDYGNPDMVKVVVAESGRALYFSRAPIPCFREGETGRRAAAGSGLVPLLHVGLYAFTRPALDWFADREPAPLEAAEKLEQLRFLAGDIPLFVSRVEARSAAVDTSEDLEVVRRLWEESKKS